MRTAWLWLGLVVVLGLPVSATAQHHEHHEKDHSRGLNGAVEKLTEHRLELGITSAQLARVQAIKDSADARKQPFWRRIMTVRRELKSRQKAQPEMPAAERAALLERSGEEIARLLEQVRGVDHDAMREVGEVLTAEQKERIRELIGRSQRDRRRFDDSREDGERRH